MPAGGLVIGGALALGQAGLGAYQYFKGKDDLSKLKQPMYQIPDEIKQNLTQAEQMALQGMPEQQRQLYLQQIAQNTQTGLRGLQDRKAGISGIGNLIQADNNAQNRLFAQDASQRLANQLKLSAQRGIMAEYKDRQFNINQLQPYQQKYNQAQNMIGAGMQNIGGGLGTGAGLAMGGFGKSSQSPPVDYTNQQFKYMGQNPNMFNNYPTEDIGYNYQTIA